MSGEELPGSYYKGGAYENRKDSVRAGKMEQGYTITIDLSSSKPIYRQIADNVITQIAMGLLAPGDKLPSSRQLSSILGINYHTVNRAYASLIQEGYVYLDRRKKVVVNEIPEGKGKKLDPEWVEKMKTLLSEALSRGFGPAIILKEVESALTQISEGKAM